MDHIEIYYASNSIFIYLQSLQCDDYRSKCQDYFNVLGINDGVMTSLCKEAESCSCPDAVDHYINPVTELLGVDVGFNETEGLYNECKCNFWLPLCEDKG